MAVVRFDWPDYLVFACSLLMSSLVGIFFCCRRKSTSTTEEFLMAGRKMNPVPVAISIFVSWMSAISFTGDPVECYLFGGVYMVLGWGYLLSVPVIAFFFAPFFNKLNIVSAYEFVEMRFSKLLRLLASISTSFTTLFWCAMANYAPSLALSQASGIPIYASILIMGGVCTFYTSIGGMRAVLWADTLQMAIMTAGQIAIIVQGCIQLGGVRKLASISYEAGRFNFFDHMNINPLMRANFWTYLSGGFARVIVPFVSNQVIVQRFSTVATPRMAKFTALAVLPMFAVMVTFLWAIGLIMYALFRDCDPLLHGDIEKRDQMVQYTVLELLGFLPGVPGLYLATLFSASLSTISSGINAMSAQLLRDIVMPLYTRCNRRALDDPVATLLAKLFAVLFGVLSTALAFFPTLLGDTVFLVASLLTGMFAGPTTAIFIIGRFNSSIKSMAMTSGFLVSVAVNVWVGVGKLYLPSRDELEVLPLSTAGCDAAELASGNSTSSAFLASSAWPYAYNSSSSSSSLVGSTVRQSGLLLPYTETVPPLIQQVNTGFHASDLYYMNALLYNVLGFTLATTITIAIHYTTVCLKKYWPAKTASHRQAEEVNTDSNEYGETKYEFESMEQSETRA